MQKKVALVAGGIGGIGAVISQRLANDYQVVACYFKNGKHEEAKKWQQEQQQLGFSVDVVYGDTGQYTDCENLVNSVIERYGQIDVLINNADIARDSCLKKASFPQSQQAFKSNLTCLFNMTHNVLPIMLDKGYGRVVSISSTNGSKKQDDACGHASKSDLYGFTKGLALEVASKGITINTISPSYIDTSTRSVMQKEESHLIADDTSVGRSSYPGEVADAVAFLVSPESGFITGVNIDVNSSRPM